MMSGSVPEAFRNIEQYPHNQLRVMDGSVQVAVTYYNLLTGSCLKNRLSTSYTSGSGIAADDV